MDAFYGCQEYKETYPFKQGDPRLDTLDTVALGRIYGGENSVGWPWTRRDKLTNCWWRRWWSDENQHCWLCGKLSWFWGPCTGGLVLENFPSIFLSPMNEFPSSPTVPSLSPPDIFYSSTLYKLQDEVRVYFSHPFVSLYLQTSRSWMLDPSLTCLSHNDSGTRANLWSVFNCLWFCASFWNFSLSPTISYSRVNMDIGVVSFVCTQLSLLTEFSVWSAYTSISHFAALRSDSRICAPWHHFHFNWALEAVRRPARS